MVTREDLVKLAREAVGGTHRPDDGCSDEHRTCPLAVTNPAAFDPPEWVLEAMAVAYRRGKLDGNRDSAGLYPEAG